jgi:D-3-phosphoglycerate dehydrogenase / 2-oxoglutarate reductase
MSPLVLRVGVYPHRIEHTVGWERSAFEQAQVRYEYRDVGSADLDAMLADAQIVLVGGGQWSAAVLPKLSKCKQLISCTVGLDHIDVEAARAMGIEVVNMPDLCTDEVADHTLGLILACTRKIAMLNDAVHGGTWDRTLLEPMPRLRGKVLGLFGFGRIGKAVAVRARAFGMDLIASDPFIEFVPDATLGVRLVEFSELCRAADVISIHAPLTPASRHAFDAEHIAMMKSTAYIVNTSRGAIVDEDALIEALGRHKIAGAALDVLESEPPARNNLLLTMPNVVLTSHTGGFSDEVVEDIPRLAVKIALQALGRSSAGDEADASPAGRTV